MTEASYVLSLCPRSLCLGHFVSVTLSPTQFVTVHFGLGHFGPVTLATVVCMYVFRFRAVMIFINKIFSNIGRL
jgi:hypothetical protein